MSVFDESSIHPANPDREVDLLVDGELSESQRRELLLQLEREPDGWRRCALAFLEAQCWRTELGQMVPVESAQQAPAQERPVVLPSAGQGRQNWRQYAATMLAMAATFLIALVGGMGLRGNWSGGSLHSPESSLVTTAVAVLPPGAATAPSAAPASQSAARTTNDWVTVTLDEANSTGSQTESLRIPALRRNTLDENLLERLPSVISPELQQAFEQSGHRVVQQREIVPLQMKDGRRLVVPVDHIQIHYVGRPSL